MNISSFNLGNVQGWNNDVLCVEGAARTFGQDPKETS